VEWVCEDQAEGKQKTAIIILTAKEQGSETVSTYTKINGR
jgi:hypothetical protein